MKEKTSFGKWLSEHSMGVLVGILVVAVVSSMVVVGVYFFNLKSLPVDTTDPAPWGQLGDYFGGTLNPVFGFLSVMALLATLVVQSRELKLTTEELKSSAKALNAQNRAIEHQSFEQTFFAWLNNYRELLGAIEWREQEETHTGRRALYMLWKDNLSQYVHGREMTALIHPTPEKLSADIEISGSSSDQAYDAPIHPPPEKYRVEISETIIDQAYLSTLDLQAKEVFSRALLKDWEAVYEDEKYQLDSLFRVLYRLILWIDSRDVDSLRPSQKWLYISIVRAQLSWIELVYLFFNGQTERGQKFKALIERYALFDNLTKDKDMVLTLLRALPLDGVGYAPAAYDSAAARKALGLPESAEEVLAQATLRNDAAEILGDLSRM